MNNYGFAAFLNGALSGYETGMDLREKYDVYKERRAKRADDRAIRAAEPRAGRSVQNYDLVQSVKRPGMPDISNSKQTQAALVARLGTDTPDDPAQPQPQRNAALTYGANPLNRYRLAR